MNLVKLHNVSNSPEEWFEVQQILEALIAVSDEGSDLRTYPSPDPQNGFEEIYRARSGLEASVGANALGGIKANLKRAGA